MQIIIPTTIAAAMLFDLSAREAHYEVSDIGHEVALGPWDQ